MTAIELARLVDGMWRARRIAHAARGQPTEWGMAMDEFNRREAELSRAIREILAGDGPRLAELDP